MIYLSEIWRAEIDLMAIDKVLYGDYNSMYEIRNPKNDIQVQCRLV